MGRAPTHHHVRCSTGPCLPAKVGSSTVTCPMAPNPAFLIGRAPAPPRVPWLRSPPPCKGGLPCATCLTAPDPASLQGRAPVRHVSCSSGSCLLAGEGSGLPHVLRFWIMPPYRKGSDAGTACHEVPCGPRASNIKKNLAGLPVRLSTCVPNARTHVSKALDVRAIIGLQDVRTGSVVNACKTCGHVATVHRQPC
jgi:hypothetical protein